MNRKNLSILFFALLTGFSSTALHAQETDPDIDVNLWAQQPVVIDGISNEWHEPLNNYNTGTKLAFALANDQKNLYLIIESLDEFTTGKVLNGGLTLTINTAGKKKDGFKINFLGMNQPPSPNSNPADTLKHQTPDQQHDHGNWSGHDHEFETAVNVIQVAGFKNIPDGALAIPNKNDIQVAAAFNKQRDYICELSIPLAELNLKGDEIKAIAYNIKINKSTKPDHKAGKSGSGDTASAGHGGMGGGHGGGGGMSGGMGGGGGHGRHGGGGMGGGRGGADTSTEDAGGQPRTSDFWIKYELARPDATFRAN